MTLVTGCLQRIYLKFYKDLERIKAVRAAAREKQPEQPNESSTEQSAKKKKEMDDMGGPNLDVFWADPETGAREYLYRRRDGKDLAQDRPMTIHQICGPYAPVPPLRPASAAQL